MKIECMDLSSVPSDVMSLTRPGPGSTMKRWVSDAKLGDTDGIAWLAWECDRLVGWSAVVDGEISVYVKKSERRKGIGSKLIKHMGSVELLSAKAHSVEAKKFYEKHDINF